MIYFLQQRAQHLLVCNNSLPQIKKPPQNRRLSPTFPRYLIKDKIFGGGGILNIKCVFWFSIQICLKHLSFRYQISRKSVQSEPSCSMRTDRQTDGQTSRS